jgi:hypothetical protein
MIELLNLEKIATTLFIAIATSSLIAIPTSILSVNLAMKKYRTEKWWDKKAECYFQTIRALNDVVHYYDALLEDKLNIKTLPEPKLKELKKEFYSAQILVQAQLNIGQLLLSKSSCKDLLDIDQVFSKAENIKDVIQKYGTIRNEIEACLNSLIENAKTDLGINKFF